MGILSGYYQRWQASRRKRDETRAETRQSLHDYRPPTDSFESAKREFELNKWNKK
jgi:hypothetical protein